ncbi:MAG: AmmeMemoRadiSam system protein A [Candidatus Acetothermia bacterium]|nr:AmmeMemoRadiSam system protein A [Candidatus Acetothermia bacterium]MDH7505158.1 AmmeMemoRadiSam system protein A [Candidatus Acetothermia bacterium]
MGDLYVELARRATEEYVRTRRRIAPPAKLPARLKERAGVFVSIKKRGALRGCIGTFLPTEENLAEEIIANAISSATRDYRFPPISPQELGELEYSVDILTPPEPATIEELDPRRYGVLVESGGRRGLLLPDLEGVETVEQQLEIARRKAGIGPDEPVQVYRFTVERHKEG